MHLLVPLRLVGVPSSLDSVQILQRASVERKSSGGPRHRSSVHISMERPKQQNNSPLLQH